MSAEQSEAMRTWVMYNSTDAASLIESLLAKRAAPEPHVNYDFVVHAWREAHDVLRNLMLEVARALPSDPAAALEAVAEVIDGMEMHDDVELLSAFADAQSTLRAAPPSDPEGVKG